MQGSLGACPFVAGLCHRAQRPLGSSCCSGCWNALPFFLRPDPIPLHGWTTLFIRPSFPGDLGCFRLLTVGSDSAVNTGEPYPLRSLLSFPWGVSQGGIAG